MGNTFGPEEFQRDNSLGEHKGWIAALCPISVPTAPGVVVASGGYDMSIRFWGNDDNQSKLQSVGGLPCANVVRSLVTYEADDGTAVLAAGESAWAVSYVELIDINKSNVFRKLSGHSMAILDLSYTETAGKKYLVSCVFIFIDLIAQAVRTRRCECLI